MSIDPKHLAAALRRIKLSICAQATDTMWMVEPKASGLNGMTTICEEIDDMLLRLGFTHEQLEQDYALGAELGSRAAPQRSADREPSFEVHVRTISGLFRYHSEHETRRSAETTAKRLVEEDGHDEAQVMPLPTIFRKRS